MKKSLFILAAFSVLTFGSIQANHFHVGVMAVAQTPAPAPAAPAAVPAVVNQAQADANASAESADTFISDVLATFTGFKGLSTWFKIALLFLLLDSSLKVSFLTPLWAKLGAKFDSLAPVLFATLAGLCIMIGTKGYSTSGLLSYFSAGVGAAGLSALLGDLSSAVGNPSLSTIITLIQTVLGGNTPSAMQARAPKK